MELPGLKKPSTKFSPAETSVWPSVIDWPISKVFVAWENWVKEIFRTRTAREKYQLWMMFGLPIIVDEICRSSEYWGLKN